MKFPASLPSRRLFRRPKTMRHKTRWNIKNCNGCWAKTTLKSEMDVNHKKTKLRKAFGTFTQLLCLQSAANRLIPIAHRFLHTPNTAETFTNLQVPHTRCANHQIWTNNIETHKNYLLALWTILRRSDEWPLRPHPTPHITDHSKQQRTFEFTSCAAFSGAKEKMAIESSRIVPLGAQHV